MNNQRNYPIQPPPSLPGQRRKGSNTSIESTRSNGRRANPYAIERQAPPQIMRENVSSIKTVRINEQIVGQSLSRKGSNASMDSGRSRIGGATPYAIEPSVSPDLKKKPQKPNQQGIGLNTPTDTPIFNPSPRVQDVWAALLFLLVIGSFGGLTGVGFLYRS